MSVQIDSLEKILLNEAAYKKRPLNGSLELLPLCNMHCKMCYVRLDHEDVLKQGGLLSLEKWMTIAKEMQKSGVLFLLLTGGEPLLFPGFKEIYLELQKLGMILTINTNGTLINEEWADFFAEHRPRRINITLYGASEETYASLCQYKKGYRKTLDGIRLLKKRNIEVKINGSITKENERDLINIYQIGKKMDIPVHIDTYMSPKAKKGNVDAFRECRLEPEKAAYIEYVSLKHELTKEKFIRYREKKIKEMENKKIFSDGFLCMAANCSFSIDWKGNMRPCVMENRLSFSVFDYGFETAWKNVIQEATSYKIYNKCRNCAYRPVCKICVASSHLEANRDGVPEYLCRYAKKMAELLQNEE